MSIKLDVNESLKDLDSYSKKGINWYPGHMAKAIKDIKEKLKLVDIVLEIRDARAPVVSGNFALEDTLRQKSRLIVLNKANLADANKILLWDKWFAEQKIPFIFVNCFEKEGMKKLMNFARKIVEEKRKASNPEMQQKKLKLKLMIIGLPNTGKSTIINQLANRVATKTADKPGQTKVLQWIVIDENLDLLDTPGIMPPLLLKEEHGTWLSALHAIPDNIVGEETPALFLIEFFKKNHSKKFQEKYKLETLDLTVEEILLKIATVRGCLKQKGLPDFERVFKLILLDFRKGELGNCCFEVPESYKL